MNSVQAINYFWNSFGWIAFEENSVPDIDPRTGTALKPPYITYDIVLDKFNHPVAMSATLWVKDTGLASISEKVEEIQNEIEYGKTIPLDNGSVIIRLEHPYAQPLSGTNDKTIKGFVLNISAEFNI